jgi:hypothetical protein
MQNSYPELFEPFFNLTHAFFFISREWMRPHRTQLVFQRLHSFKSATYVGLTVDSYDLTKKQATNAQTVANLYHLLAA